MADPRGVFPGIGESMIVLYSFKGMKKFIKNLLEGILRTVLSGFLFLVIIWSIAITAILTWGMIEEFTFNPGISKTDVLLAKISDPFVLMLQNIFAFMGLIILFGFPIAYLIEKNKELKIIETLKKLRVKLYLKDK